MIYERALLQFVIFLFTTLTSSLEKEWKLKYEFCLKSGTKSIEKKNFPWHSSPKIHAILRNITCMYKNQREHKTKCVVALTALRFSKTMTLLKIERFATLVGQSRSIKRFDLKLKWKGEWKVASILPFKPHGVLMQLSFLLNLNWSRVALHFMPLNHRLAFYRSLSAL